MSVDTSRERMSPDRDTVRFTPSLAPVLGVVALTTALAALSVTAHATLLGPNPDAYPRHVSTLLSLPFTSLIVLGGWAALHHEGVSLDDVGLDRSALLPGVAAFGLLWSLVSLFGVSYLLATGAGGRIGVQYDLPLRWVLVWFLLTLTLSNGIPEEFVFRGYVQNKCLALTEWLPRAASIAVAILAAGVLFGVPHVPYALVLADASPVAIPWVLLQNALVSILYGGVYHLTRNVWYTAFVHGFSNAPVLPFETGAVPLFDEVAIGALLVVTLGYWRWESAPASPTTGSAETGTSVDGG